MWDNCESQKRPTSTFNLSKPAKWFFIGGKGDCAMTVTVQAYFQHILQLSFPHECPSIEKCPKFTKNMPAW
jgi:hypothetical protein